MTADNIYICIPKVGGVGPIYSPSEIDLGSIPLGILKLKVILYSYLGPFGKNSAQPKTRQKGETFSMMHVVSHRI